jgi:excisionase family DNA binding protein
MTEERMLTTPEVAARLNISTRRVLALIESGRLPSQQFGRDHVIKESDLKLVADRKTGRPPGKQAADKAATQPANGSNAALTAAAKAKKKGKK